jgi:hypothetical protein
VLLGNLLELCDDLRPGIHVSTYLPSRTQNLSAGASCDFSE